MINSRRAQVTAATETVAKAVKSAGGVVVAALIVACAGLAIALVALVLAARGQSRVIPIGA